MKHKNVSEVVARNIAQLVEQQQIRIEEHSWFHRVSERVTHSVGSLRFLLFHLFWFGIWILINLDVSPFFKVFDPYPFGFLTFIVSLEAIALSLMVLMVQNEIQQEARRRAELDLHVNLLAEQESTIILKKLSRIEEHLNIKVAASEKKEVDDLVKETNPVEIQKTLDESFKASNKKQ